MRDRQAKTARGRGRVTARRLCGAVLATCMLALGGCTLDEPGAYSFGYGDAGPVPARWQPGLATGYNAAILADDPRDLDRPRRETSRDAARRDAVISAYRADGATEARGTATRNSGGRQ